MGKMQKIQPEQWILVVSVLLLLGLVITALTPDTHGHAQQQAIGIVPGNVMQSAAQGQQQGQMVAQGQTVAALRPFAVAPPHSYQGLVERVVNRDPGGWGQIHIIVKDGMGNRREISLAPAWYMDFQGCVLEPGQQVSGEVFRFENGPQAGRVLYAKNVIINGARCRLRSIDGLALWSDQLQ